MKAQLFKYWEGNQRTAAQDMEFVVHQLVEIAVRTLSPGINDPFTAAVCVDRLGSALSRLAQREEDRRDADDRYQAASRALREPDVQNHAGLDLPGPPGAA